MLALGPSFVVVVVVVVVIIILFKYRHDAADRSEFERFCFYLSSILAAPSAFTFHSWI